MTWVATRQDLMSLGGLPAEAYQPDARELAGVHLAEQLFELRGHGLSSAPVRYAVRAGGTLPAPLSPLTWYTVPATADPDFFAPGVTITTAGSGSIWVLENFWPKIDAMLVARSDWLVAWHRASRGPWSIAPAWAPMIVAQLVAGDACRALRLPSARYPVETVLKAAADVQPFLDQIHKGEIFSDGIGPVDATPTVAEMGPTTVHLKGRGFLRLDGREDLA